MRNTEFKKIKDIIEFCKRKVPYYRSLLKNFEFKGFSDFEKIPLLTNKIYRDSTPPVDNSLLSREDSGCFVFSSGGTTTNSRYVLRDFKDFDDQYKDYIGLDVGKKDTAINLFMPGMWGIFTSTNLSLIQLGCKIIPFGGANLTKTSKKQIALLIDKFNVNLLLGVPSTIISIANFLNGNGKQIAQRITKIFCLGEKIHQSTLDYLKTIFPNALIKSKYGCMETAGVGYQCKYLNGNKYHVFPTHFVEIIGFKNKRKVPIGMKGKILVTTLKKRLVPLLRYETNDIGRFLTKKCPCGEEKVLEILGREEDMLITASVHLTIDSLEKVLDNFKQCTSNFQLIAVKKSRLDFIKVFIEIERKKVKDETILTKKICKEWFKEIPDIYEAIKSKKINGIEIIFVPIGTIKRVRATGKIKRIIDLRK